MPTLKLGTKPNTLVLTLVEGADFVARLRTKADEQTGVRPDWPDGAKAILALGEDGSETRWESTLDGDSLIFNVPSEEADVIPANSRALLFYRQGEFDAVWAKGSVTRA